MSGSQMHKNAYGSRAPPRPAGRAYSTLLGTINKFRKTRQK